MRYRVACSAAAYAKMVVYAAIAAMIFAGCFRATANFAEPIFDIFAVIEIAALAAKSVVDSVVAI